MPKIPKKDWINPKVEIRGSNVEGQGMFAVAPIKKDEVVMVWGGKYVNKKDAELAKKEGGLVMQWDEDLYSVEERGDDRGYFVNHSCNSNLWLDDYHTLTARRDIQKGEEITADYALWEANENFGSKWKCRCGSPLCRGKITGKDWKNEELQERYKEHFSPLLNKRITDIL